jgi:hypothetical protein
MLCGWPHGTRLTASRRLDRSFYVAQRLPTFLPALDWLWTYHALLFHWWLGRRSRFPLSGVIWAHESFLRPHNVVHVDEVGRTDQIVARSASNLCEREVANIQHDPRWSVVAGVVLAPHPSVYTAVHEALAQFRRQ